MKVPNIAAGYRPPNCAALPAALHVLRAGRLGALCALHADPGVDLAALCAGPGGDLCVLCAAPGADPCVLCAALDGDLADLRAARDAAFCVLNAARYRASSRAAGSSREWALWRVVSQVAGPQPLTPSEWCESLLG